MRESWPACRPCPPLVSAFVEASSLRPCAENKPWGEEEEAGDGYQRRCRRGRPASGDRLGDIGNDCDSQPVKVRLHCLSCKMRLKTIRSSSWAWRTRAISESWSRSTAVFPAQHHVLFNIPRRRVRCVVTPLMKSPKIRTRCQRSPQIRLRAALTQPGILLPLSTLNALSIPNPAEVPRNLEIF